MYSCFNIFTEEVFQANEPGAIISILVSKNSLIATPIVLDVIPLTVSEARNCIPTDCLPESIPEDNPFSPPFAGNNISSIRSP